MNDPHMFVNMLGRMLIMNISDISFEFFVLNLNYFVTKFPNGSVSKQYVKRLSVLVRSWNCVPFMSSTKSIPIVFDRTPK